MFVSLINFVPVSIWVEPIVASISTISLAAARADGKASDTWASEVHPQ